MAQPKSERSNYRPDTFQFTDHHFGARLRGRYIAPPLLLFLRRIVVFSAVLKPSRKKTRKQEMDTEECQKALLTRVRKVTPWNAEAIVRRIFTTLTLDKIRLYVDGSDAYLHALIDEMKRSMRPRARSPGKEFPPPSWNSQGQSSNTFEAIQAPPAGQSGNSQLPGSPSVPDDESIDLKEHSQSSSVPGCSNVTGCAPSSSRLWPRTCYFYISRLGHCKKGLSCESSHGFGPSGKLEMEIRQLLLMIPSAAIFVVDLPWIYHEQYNKHLPVEPCSIPSLARSLHTICWVPGSYPLGSLVLLERYQAHTGYPAHLWDCEVLTDERPKLIYISFSAASRSICTRNVSLYFCQYGHVLSVSIQRSFGFVRFEYPETIELLLLEWNPEVPHFICGEAVMVRRYIPKGEAKLKNSSVKHGLENGCDPEIVTEKSSGTSGPEISPPLTHSQPSHSQIEINPPEGGDATGSPDEDSEDHSQPSHSQVEINPLEGGEVPGGLDGDAADEQIDDEVARLLRLLPDIDSFYEQT